MKEYLIHLVIKIKAMNEIKARNKVLGRRLRGQKEATIVEVREL